MISARQNQSSASKRVVIPVTSTDRQRLHEIKEKLGSWTAVSEALGFRGASTARKWALSDSTTFKGRDYPERIKQLHEKVVGRPVKEPTAQANNLGKRMDRVEEKVETMLEMLSKALSGETPFPPSKRTEGGAA